jgi:hypothetical protein
MSTYDESRYRMHQRFDDVLGSEVAATVMEHLPPLGWHEIATKADLRALGAATKADVSALGADLRALGTATKADLRALGTATKADLRALGAATKADLRALEAATRSDLRALEMEIGALEGRIDTRLEGLRAEFQRDLRLQGFALLGAIATVNAAAVAVTQMLS